MNKRGHSNILSVSLFMSKPKVSAVFSFVQVNLLFFGWMDSEFF